MLRHACGFALANAGHDTRALQAYLGHANIQNTTRYTAFGGGKVQGILAGLTQAWPRGTVGKPKGLSRKHWFAAKRLGSKSTKRASVTKCLSELGPWRPAWEDCNDPKIRNCCSGAFYVGRIGQRDGSDEKPPHEALAHDGHVRKRAGHSTMCMRF